jgi:hypothetical protein
VIKWFQDWLSRGTPTAIAFWAIVGGTILAWIANLLFFVSLSLSITRTISFSDLFAEFAPRFHLTALGLIVVAAGVYRAFACHPLADRKYGAWLAQTPWRYPEPLPLGSIHLGSYDAVVMLSVAVMACLPPTRWSFILNLPWLYPIAYAVTLCGVHWFAGLRCPVVLALILFGLIIATQSAIAITVSLVIIAPIVWWSIGAVLRDFPYSESRRRQLGLLPHAIPREVPVIWPVVPEPDSRWYQRIGSGEAFAVAATVGWMLFAIASASGDSADAEPGLRVWCRMIAVIAIGIRLGGYVVEHLPPLSLLGRWKWKRWVIPGYDVVFLAPLASGMAAYLLPSLLVRCGVSTLAALPIATAVTIWLAAALPPKWEVWHYTGHYRCSLTGLINHKTDVQA